jgi:hypothetical protein
MGQILDPRAIGVADEDVRRVFDGRAEIIQRASA